MFLATTSLDEFWDKQDKLLFLGDWCTFIHEKQKWQNLTYSYAPQVTSDKKSEQSLLRETYRNALYQLTDFLNQYHSIDLPNTYYQDAMGIWLSFQIELLFRYYKLLRTCRDNYGNSLHTILLDELSYYVPVSFYDNQVNINDKPVYQLQLFSQVYRGLGLPFTTKKAQKRIPQKFNYSVSPQNRYTSLIRKISTLLSTGSQSTVTLTAIYHDKRKQVIDIWKRMPRSLIFDEMDYATSLDFKIDQSARKQKLDLGNHEYQKIFGDMILRNIPMMYLEGLQTFRKHVLSLPIRKTKAIFSVNAIWYNEIYKFFLAENPQITRLYMQHGGGYGIENWKLTRFMEINLNHIYYTWGWEDVERCKYMPHPKISYQQNKPTKRASILFIQTSDYVSFFGQTFYRKYLEDSITFFNNIKHKQHLLVRDHPHRRWETASFVKQKIQGVKFDDFSEPFHKRIQNAKICVFDHMMTTWLQTMGSNIPTLVYINPDMYDLTDKAQECIDELVQQNIFHYSPASAAEHLNKIYDDVQGWWSSKEVQKAKNNFVYHYARADKNWAKIWATEFKRVLNEKK